MAFSVAIALGMKKTSATSLLASRPVESLIHVIRGQKVMLDADLAQLYGVQTRVLVQAVKRNLSRFPVDFMFQLNAQEVANLKSQSVISSSDTGHGGRRTAPYVFTEQGVAMLSAVLTSPHAILVSIAIMRTFVRMRELLATNRDIAARVEKLERNHDRTGSVIEVLVEDIDRLAVEVKRMKATPASARRKIGFDL